MSIKADTPGPRKCLISIDILPSLIYKFFSISMEMHRKAGAWIFVGSILIFLLFLEAYPLQDISPAKKLDFKGLLKSTIDLGDECRLNGDFEKALIFFKDARDYSRQLKIKETEVDCLVKLGFIYWDLGQIEESGNSFKNALALIPAAARPDASKVIKTALEIVYLYSEGKNLYASHQYPQSIRSYDQAIELSKEKGFDEFELKCLRRQCLNYWELNELTQFYEKSKQALALAVKIKHKIEEGRCLNNIGLYFWKGDNYSYALKYFEQALIIAREMKELENQAGCLNNIGMIYSDLGDFDKAINYFNEALSIDKKLGNKHNTAIDLNNLGIELKNRSISFRTNDDLYKALACFRECLSLLKDNENTKTLTHVLNSLGNTYTLMSNYDMALASYEKANARASSALDFDSQGMIRNNIAILSLKQNKIDKAINYFRSAIKLGSDVKSKQVLWEAYFGLGQCHESSNERIIALSYYLRAAEVIEKIRQQINIDTFKAGFLRNKIGIYDRIINMLLTLYSDLQSEAILGEIFLTVERSKARAFLEGLAEAKIDPQENLNPDLKKRESEVSNKISAIFFNLSKAGLAAAERQNLLKQLEQVEDEHLRIISEIRIESPNVANVVYPETCSIDDVKTGLLDEKTAVAEYFLGERKSFLFLITKNRTSLHVLPPKEEIEISLRAYLKMLSAPAEKGFMGNLGSERIAKELLTPIIDEVPNGIENLIIIPDGILYYLPFESLRLRGDSGGNNGAFLVEKVNVYYAPSSSSLLFMKKKEAGRKAFKGLLAFGNPVYDRGAPANRTKPKTSGEILREIYINQGFDFSPLPDSRKEVMDISGYFLKGKKLLFLGSDAKEEIVKELYLPDFNIIHFACHGLLDEKFPFRSALVLSLDDDRKEDGFLQVREIYGLRMNADLVVLSACQTGRGSLEKGEGLLGLPRIFFYAGAKSVLSTLWPINDRSTSIFMNDFYNYLSLGYTKSRALRLAKTKMIKSKYSQPYYWAGFVLTGDCDSNIRFH